MKSINANWGKYASFVFAVVIVLMIFTGWRLRNNHLITAEKGLGYIFGVIGFVLMTILMLYPLRKRLRFLTFIGGVKAWFRIHMMLGVIGPVFILFHCNFQLGSFNSNVALFSMLVVSISGIFGRYFYSRIHHGLYGERESLVSLREKFDLQKKEFTPQLDLIPGIKEKIFAFSDWISEPPKTLGESIRNRMLLGWSIVMLRRSMRRMAEDRVNKFAADHNWSNSRRRKMIRQMTNKTNAIIGQSVKVAEFGFYERLFGLWHLFHIPLVYMLFIAAVIHIVAVHLY